MILKHRDKELLRFDWIDDARVRIVSVNDRERRFLPLDFGTPRQDDDPDAFRYRLEDWLMTRSAPVGRHFMRDLMDSIGLNINSPAYHRKALDFSKGLSLNDVYWVVPDDFPGTWSECNLYDNAFSEALAEIAFTGNGKFDPRKATTSPEMTTNGMLPKCWVREDDGIYNLPNERIRVLSGFLQKRASDICSFKKETDLKCEQSLVLESINSNENVGVKATSESVLNVTEQKAATLILRNSFITESEIANQLEMTIRQVERVIASLKRKAGLKRRGSDKVGEWCFE